MSTFAIDMNGNRMDEALDDDNATNPYMSQSVHGERHIETVGNRSTSKDRGEINQTKTGIS